MTLAEMTATLRQHLSDEQNIGWPWDTELIAYLDRAAAYVSNQLIASKDPAMLKRFTIYEVTDLPEDFTAFVGNVPVIVTGRQCESYGKFDISSEPRWRDATMPHDVGSRSWDEEPATWDKLTTTDDMEVLYWGRLPYPSSFASVDTLPYTAEQSTLIIEAARMLALNKNEYDLSQDMTLLGEMNKAMAAARRR
jgi:hypothetical protein